ncbi:4Fe-4S dicluster domain-containing protein [Candidatus Bathyarchaeota archaeon]|nr:4Fe-4S dicluster domain-containing protein [Candidatus Bathyarchaeota archaeon]
MSKKKIFENLIEDVVDNDLCVSCGTCVAVCPVNVIELKKEIPNLVGKCIECGLCYSNCPRTDFEKEEMDKIVFDRERKEYEDLIGIYDSVYQAKTKIKSIGEKAQDGGIVSSILKQFIKENGEGAIVAGLSEKMPWAPKPFIAKNESDILKAAGTKYTSSPTLLGLKEAVKNQKLDSIAVVGTPCQIRGLTRITKGKFKNKKYDDAVQLNIGLFCMETFRYDDWIDYLKENNVNPEEVTKFEIKNGRFYAKKGDNILHEAKLSKVKKLVRPCCHQCDDFSSEYADLSVGNVGSPEGWSTVIARTDRGKNILFKAEKANLIILKPIEDFDEQKTLVHKLAKLKRK